jgi:predicted neutral ceramidase superfamily lipid hydrolase
MDLGQLVLLIIAIALVSIIFYISGAIVSGDWVVQAPYVLRIVIVSIFAVVAIPVFRNAMGEFDLGDLGLLFAFVLLILAVRFIMVIELTVSDEWLASIVISLIGVVLIYMVDEAAMHLADVQMLSLF